MCASDAQVLSEAEIAELYQRYGHAIYKRCLRLLHRPEDAREMMQETFYQACKNRMLFRGASSQFTFLYRIATNLCIDRLRRRKTSGEETSLTEVRSLEAGGQSQEQRAAAIEEILVLTEGWDEEALAVVVMSHLDGLTHEEIAEQLGLTRSGVTKRLTLLTEAMRSRRGEKV